MIRVILCPVQTSAACNVSFPLRHSTLYARIWYTQWEMHRSVAHGDFLAMTPNPAGVSLTTAAAMAVAAARAERDIRGFRQPISGLSCANSSSSSSSKTQTKAKPSLITQPKRHLHLHRISYLTARGPSFLFSLLEKQEIFLLNPEFNTLYVTTFCTHLAILQVHRGIGRAARAEMSMLIM